MRTCRRVFALPAAERRLLLEAWRWLVEARVVLWLLPFRRVQQRFDVERVAARGAPVRDAAGPDAVAEAVRRARRLVPAASCLPQALAARSMLARRGVASDLHIGVGKDEGGHLQAHAWVEVGGRVVVGDLPDLARFRRVRSSPGGVR